MRIISERWAWLVAHCPIDRRDVLAFAGIASLVYGIAQVSPPAAWMSAGAVMLLIWLAPLVPARKKG